MITVHTFIRHSAVWRQATPMLEPFIRWANENCHGFGRAVPSMGDAQRNALIAETAFMLASAPRGLRDTDGIEEDAREYLLTLPRGRAAVDRLTFAEWIEVRGIRGLIDEYVGMLNEPTLFAPTIPGCGVVDPSVGDIISGHQLIELKAVTRAFRGVDLRQALTYGAMLYASGQEMREVTLLNPRQGVYFRLPIDLIASEVSGHSWVEMYMELVEWMTGLQVSA